VVARSIRKARRWKGEFNNGIVTSLGLNEVAILAPADYEQSTTLEPSGVTMGACHLQCAIEADTASLHIGFMLYVVDNDEALSGGVTSVKLTDEDVIWAGAQVATPEHPALFTLDTKSMRKLHNDRLVFVIDNNTAGTGIFTCVSRVMVLGG